MHELGRSQNMPEEQWRKIPGFDGRYEVSDHGRVRSWINQAGRLRAEPFYMKPYLSKDGYHALHFRVNKKTIEGKLHRLVMLAFAGPSSLEVNHKDGDKLNNSLDNLEYVNRQENVHHAIYKLGVKRGHRPRKTNKAQDRQIRTLVANGVPRHEIALHFGISRTLVSRIANGGRIRKVISSVQEK